MWGNRVNEELQNIDPAGVGFCETKYKNSPLFLTNWHWKTKSMSGVNDNF